jgi:phosphoglycerate dehydrogenase-like enzyme
MPDPIRTFVLTQSPLPDPLIERLRAVSPRLQVEHRAAGSIDELGDALAEVEVLYTTGMLPAPERVPNLRWVQGHFAGVDGVIGHPTVQQAHVTLTTSSGVHASNMGEYVLMMMLAFAHRLPRMLEHQARGEWTSKRWEMFVPRELRDSTLGIVGYGSIGREVARLARTFGTRVLAAKRDPARHGDEGWQLEGTGDPTGDYVERFYAPSALDEMLPECDFVLLIVPLTPETRHLIGPDQLRQMKRDAVLINVARGGVVDEQALIDALQNGVIGGAALDVFSREPLPADSPLWKLPNVILSPHVSGFTPHYDERAMQLFAENLRRYVAGEKLLNVVDFKHGF